MALVRLAECAVLPAPSRDTCIDYSLTEVSFVLNDLSWRSVDDSKHIDKLENEVMVDAWSSMESTNSPLTDSGPSASDDCTPSTSSGLRDHIVSPLSPEARCNLPDSTTNSARTSGLSRGIDTTRATDRARSRDLTLDLQTLDNLPTSSRRHFLDDDYQSPTKLNIECRIPKPHFLDHSPSPDEFDERSDITNPNFLDDDVIEDVTKSGVLSKKPVKGHSTNLATPEDRSHRSNYRIALHYGLESAARSSERDKRASQLYQRTWPGEKEAWIGHDTASVRSFSSNGSTEVPRPSSNLENKMECVYSLLSLLTLSPDNNADLSGSLLEMSRSVDSCIAMRQAGCIPLLVQLIHSKLSRETRDRAAKALRNIIHTQTDDKSGRREARVWRLLEQVREYCYILEDLVESRKDGKEGLEDDATKHPSQCVAALMKLSFDEEHRHVVCHLGGLQALAALVSGDQAAHGSQTHDATCLTMRRYAGMTLTNLTFGDGNNKTLLCSFKDFMMALVEQLESPNDDMRQVTAAVLRNLSWRADANSKQILREVGAVKGLTKAAMTCQKEATLKSVLSALWNLTAHCSMNKIALCSVDGALGFLVDMLSYNSPTKTLAIVENAGGIMRNVSSHIAVREDYRQILRERNCLSVLLQHLKSPSLTVVSNSCGTLWNLSARCPHDQQFLWDHGAVPMLRSLIHSKHKMIAMGSSAALKNLLNSKPGKSHIVSLDSTARNMNLPALPTLGARKQKALEQELDQNLAETCDNIEPATSPSSSHRDEKNLFTATERQIAMNLERHRMTSSSPLAGVLASQISLSHSANLPGYLSCSNTLLKGSSISRSATEEVNRSDSKDSVASAQSDSAFERATRTGKVPVPTPRSKDFVKIDPPTEAFKVPSQPKIEKFKSEQPPVPTPRTNYTESGFDVDQDSCDQPIDYSRKYSESKPLESPIAAEVDKGGSSDYQETDLDQPTDYSLRYAEHQTEAPSVDEDTIERFCTEGTPYETPVIFSTATSMSDLRVIGHNKEAKKRANVKEEKEPSNERRVLVKEKRGGFETKMSSGLGSPEKPVQYCEEGTPGYFSRVSSLSSLGEPAPAGLSEDAANQTKDKDGSKAVTFARFPEADQTGPNVGQADPNADQTDPNAEFVQDTPLMFSRTSSLDSIPECDGQDEHISVESEHSRMTSCCISPSELPDSPPRAPSAPLSPPPGPATPPDPPPEMGTVFEERMSAFIVENTPAQFSTATSLSELTIPDDKSLHEQLIETSDVADEPADAGELSPHYTPRHLEQSNDLINENVLVTEDIGETPKEADTCHVYITEDTPALSDISAGSDRLQLRNRACSPDHNTSKSFPTYEGVYHSLPPYLRSSTETVRMSQDVSRHATDKGSPPPPLPPKSCNTVAPPRPPTYLPGKKHESRLPVKAQRFSKSLTRNDSLSSLSLDSFGSTDREIFEQTVKAGVDNVKPRRVAIDTDKSHVRQHKSLDRSDKITQHKHRSRDMDKGKQRKSAMTRSPHSFPGDLSNSLTHRADRSDSLSSLSNDSFGSTDKEVFERCVRLGMSHPKKTDDERLRNKQDDKRRKREPARPVPGALDKMQGHKYSRDRAILEEVIAKGAGEKHNSKNVPAPFAARASVDGNADNAPSNPQTIGCENSSQAIGGEDNSQTIGGKHNLQAIECEDNSQTTECLERPNELPTVHSPNTTVDSFEDTHMNHSNECLAPLSANTTLRSDVTDRLDRSHDHPDDSNDHMNHSNESYADVLDGSISDSDSPPENQTGTLKRLQKPHQWTDLKVGALELDEISSKKTHDTWNDNTCPDDVTFPTMSGSTHMVASIRSEIAEIGIALPDLLEKSGKAASAGPDLTDKLDDEYLHLVSNASINNDLGTSANFNLLIDSIPEPSFTSLLEDSESKFTSLMSAAIQKEATRLAAQLKSSQFAMENSVTSVNSLDLENVKPPSDPLGSLLSLSASGNFDENQTGKKSRRKKSLPVSSMVRRALSNSINQSSSEHLDANPVSFLENVKPPSELEMLDMESSMRSVCSIHSEVVDPRDQAPVVFDLKQPIQDFPLCNNFVFQDLETVNPPSLFDEIGESTVELEQTTAHNVFEDCISNTLNIVTDIPSGSETCTPIPSDVSSVESTPKRNCLTPKQRRQATKDRYQTYTITDSVSDDTQIVLEVDSEEFLTWTKSESDSRSDDYLTAASEPKIKRKLSAKQRRQEDRARYQTQTVDIGNILSAQTGPDPQIENLKQCLTRKSIKQKRAEDADRYKTRTLSEEVSPSPIARDNNVENAETTTGYGSLSSNEPGPSTGDRTGETDSGHNEDDFELNSVQMRTYTQSFRNYLPVVESPAAVDLCVKNNLKNMRLSGHQDPSTSDFASLEGDDGCHSDSDSETRVVKPKPKITKPEERREESLDSNESLDTDSVKGIRGRKKASYVSPYRRNVTAAKSASPPNKPAPLTSKSAKSISPPKPATKPVIYAKSKSSNTSPKRTLPVKSPAKSMTKPIIVPLSGAKPLPLERQGTFTKETADKKAPAKITKTAKTSPSRLPQPNSSRFVNKPPLKKAVSNDKPQAKRPTRPNSSIKTSASNHSLQSDDSGKTVTLAKSSRQGSTTSVNGVGTKAKEVESKIASLWRKVEQSKKIPTQPDRRIWIEHTKPEPPRLVRSSTFDRPKVTEAAAADKQKSQIPSLRPKSIPSRSAPATGGKVFARRHLNGQTS